MATIFTHLPPSRLHSSGPVSSASALTLLSSFIASAASDPSLQPHAVLGQSGPTSATNSGSGLTIHNLKRVEAGLRGEQLGEDLTFKKYGGEDVPELMKEGDEERKKERKRRRSEVEEVEMGAQKEEWVDRDEFEQDREEENVEEADIDDRVQGTAEGDDAKQNRMVQVIKGANGKADKEARKKAKKERSKAEKKDREKRRQGEKSE